MKILVIGSGGREHAVVWKLRQSASVEKVWCAPGNGGIARDAQCEPLDLSNVKEAADLALRLGADLTIVGPELPLVLGISGEFARRGLPLLGPSQQAAQLEGSKVFAKEFMQRHRIPTAAVHGICESAADAQRLVASARGPLVIKADGLCAGKGVLVTSDREEASKFVDRLTQSSDFADAGKRIMFEEALSGVELSYIILTDGEKFISMAPTRDHKRAFDNDEGPNTGGMGAYSTDAILPAALEAQILATIVRPTLAGLRADGMEYRGFLYFGLMLTPEGPKVLEYNCRLGDPETEAIMLRANFDFPAACMDAAVGNLQMSQPNWAAGASVCVVIASEGYPEKPLTGKEIGGLDEADRAGSAVVFHAGTRRENARYYTNGGRVLVVSANGPDLSTARETVYNAIQRIRIEGSHYRRDIGAAVARKEQEAVQAGKP